MSSAKSEKWVFVIKWDAFLCGLTLPWLVRLRKPSLGRHRGSAAG